MKRLKIGLILVCLLSGLACTLTSPTPASWARTPTAQAEARTETAAAQTAQAVFAEDPTKTPLPQPPTQTEPPPTQTPTRMLNGPWLVFPQPGGGGLAAFDLEAKQNLEIDLPQPIYFTDLLDGRSPQDGILVIRAGSPENLDELALYQVKLPEAEVTKITPLLSLRLQRQIVNQEGSRAAETLQALTREQNLAWSPDGRYLAFSAALDNDSSDLYVYDSLRQEIRRLNGLYTHNGRPFWSPGGNWLVSQEFDRLPEEGSWNAVNFTALRVPGYDDQNALYQPPEGSLGEVYLGWINAQSFLCYSQTAEGPQKIRQVNLESLKTNLVFDSPFLQAAFDPETKLLALIQDQGVALSQGDPAGIYVIDPGTTRPRLIRAGDFNRLSWDQGGVFIAAGPRGVFAFPPDGASFFLAEEAWASLSPSKNWMIAWGEETLVGARLYQPPVSDPLQTIWESPVQEALWQPDSRGFFLLTEGALVQFAFPGLNPDPIATGLDEQIPPMFIWIE